MDYTYFKLLHLLQFCFFREHHHRAILDEPGIQDKKIANILNQSLSKSCLNFYTQLKKTISP